MATLTDRFARRWELHHPLVLSIGVLVLALCKGPAVYAYAAAQGWHLDQLYICVFTLATVITAFLLTFYTFIVTGDRGFLQAARETVYFRQTVVYTMRAIIVGAVLALACIPMLVVQPTPEAGDPWMFVAALWAALTVWATASFVRAAWLFAHFAGK